MKLFLAFSVEGNTDKRFIPILVERIIKEYLTERQVSAEFNWLPIPRKGSSRNNILAACKAARNHHLVVFHRDSGNKTWDESYTSHFSSAIGTISANSKGTYNSNIVPAIIVKETESWMLCNKQLLKDKIETSLTDNELGLNYRVAEIEEIRDPKSKIERAVKAYHDTLTKKQRGYAATIEDLYDLIATDILISDLEVLDSFNRFKNRLVEILDDIGLEEM